MSVGFITLAIWLALLVLLLTGLPVAFCLLSVAAFGYLIFSGPQALYTLLPIAFTNLTKDIYLAVPLFIFMAAVLQSSGLGAALYEMMYKWFAGLRGGLAMGTVAICTIIAATTGLSATATISMGLLAYPEMRKRGYDKGLAIGSITAGGCLGPLIPPSLLMIVVGGFASLSVGKLFMGGVFPGLLMAAFFMIYIGVKCFREPDKGPSISKSERATWKEKLLSLRGSVLPLALIIVVLGTIYLGVCTPTEAGGIGAVGTLVCAAIYRNLSLRSLKEAAVVTFQVSAMVMWIIIGGAAFASLCGITGVTDFISSIISVLPLGAIGVLVISMIIVFILGMFIDSLAITMITIPVFMPLIIKLGIDPLWFSLLFVINCIIGFLTPPFGANLFYFKGLGFKEVSMIDIYRGNIPFVAIMLLVLVLCILFPQITLWLPSKMIG